MLPRVLLSCRFLSFLHCLFFLVSCLALSSLALRLVVSCLVLSRLDLESFPFLRHDDYSVQRIALHLTVVFFVMNPRLYSILTVVLGEFKCITMAFNSPWWKIVHQGW